MITKTRKQLKCTRTDGRRQKLGYVYTAQYHSDRKEDEAPPFPVTGRKLERVIPSDVRWRMTSIGYHFLRNLNMDRNKLLYEGETAS